MRKEIFIVLCIAVFAAVFCYKGFADTFTIDVVPEDNSTTLNLTPLSAIRGGEEKTVTVSIEVISDLAERYEVRQQMLDFLQNEDGVRLDPCVVIFHTLQGSNRGGSLLLEEQVNLDTSENVVYSSAEGGERDKFTVIYSVKGNLINSSGKFQGRIRYSLVPRGGNGKGIEQEKILDVYLEAKKEESEIDVETSSGSADRLVLSAENGEINGRIDLKLKGLSEEICTLTQTVAQNFRDEKEEEIPLDIVKFSLFSQRGESNYSSFTPLERNLLVYSSKRGVTEDEIAVNFTVDKEKIYNLESGKFTAKFEYKLRTPQGDEKVIPLEIELEVMPVFEVEIIPEEGGSGISFSDLRPDSPPAEKEIIVEVKTNRKKPYIVVQNLKTPLTNDNGDVIPLEYFSIKEERDSGELGEIVFQEKTAVKLGDIDIFVSDVQGRPAKFKVKYCLDIPVDLKGGHYFTSISYSLVEK